MKKMACLLLSAFFVGGPVAAQVTNDPFPDPIGDRWGAPGRRTTPISLGSPAYEVRRP